MHFTASCFRHSLTGFEKNMPVRSRSPNGGEYELGVVVRVKANGNYDIEKRVDDVSLRLAVCA